MSTENQTTQAAPEPGSEAYNEAMAAKGAALREAPPDEAELSAPSERPSWLPEKFKSAEDLAAAYAELEKRQGKPKDKPAEKKDDTLEIPDVAEAALEEKGIDLSGLQAEYAENGDLKEETYERLGKAGFSRDDVNTYIAGQLALVERTRTEAFGLVGGEDTFSAMQEWASVNLTASEKAAFNNAVKGDAAAREMAILGLHAKYTRTVGTEGRPVHGGAAGNASGDHFESRAQLVAAMNNPLYAKDPAYRKTVADKLVRTRNVNPIF